MHTDRAEIALAHGDTTTARRELLLALPHVRMHERQVRFWLVTLAGWLLASSAQDNAVLSAQCLAAEEGLGERGGPLSPIYRTLIAQRRQRARERIDAAQWSALWRTERTWTPQQALTCAETWLNR